MWAQLNRRLKHSAPRLHSWLKGHATAWQNAAAPRLPAPRWIRGDFFWVHPRLLSLDTTDHEPHISRWIMSRLHPGAVFFDVGAHFGWLSLKAARRVGRKGRVVAFEASAPAVEILSYHQRVNRLPQMEIVAKAVSETDADEIFYLLDEGLSSRNSLMIGASGLPFLDGPEKPQKSASRVAAVKLDTYCEAAHLRPDVIKIDVEGAEGKVLRGACGILRQFRPVLVLSMHPYWFPSSESAAAILNMLAGYGYRIHDSHVVQFQDYEIGDYLLR